MARIRMLAVGRTVTAGPILCARSFSEQVSLFQIDVPESTSGFKSLWVRDPVITGFAEVSAGRTPAGTITHIAGILTVGWYPGVLYFNTNTPYCLNSPLLDTDGFRVAGGGPDDDSCGDFNVYFHGTGYAEDACFAEVGTFHVQIVPGPGTSGLATAGWAGPLFDLRRYR